MFSVPATGHVVRARPTAGSDRGKRDLTFFVRQKSNTRHLIYDVPRLIEFASSFYTLNAGDVIMTGTPAGVGPVKPGDRLDMCIEKVGSGTIWIAPNYASADHVAE